MAHRRNAEIRRPGSRAPARPSELSPPPDGSAGPSTPTGHRPTPRSPIAQAPQGQSRAPATGRRRGRTPEPRAPRVRSPLRLQVGRVHFSVPRASRPPAVGANLDDHPAPAFGAETRGFKAQLGRRGHGGPPQFPGVDVVDAGADRGAQISNHKSST